MTDSNISSREALGDVQAGSSRWLLFGLVSVALSMASIDQSIVSTALPTISRQLGASINWTSLVVSGYALGLVVAMPMAGRTSDQYGRKRVFLASIAVFTLASLLCGVSANVYELVPLRVLQAIGGGAFLPSAIGIISDSFGEERDRAIGLTSSILPIGGIVGPVLGGVFINYWSWRGIFLVNVPIGVALYVGVRRAVPASVRQVDAHTDLVGVLHLAVIMVGVMVAITALGYHSVEPWSPVVVAALLITAVAVGAFVHRARRVAVPIVPLHLIGGRGFLVMNAINFVFGAAVMGLGSLIPLYAQDRYRISVINSGALLTARAIGLIGVAFVAVYLLRRTGYRTPIGTGMALTAVGLLMIAVHPLVSSPFWWLAGGGLVTGIAFGLAAPATNNAILSLAPEHVGAITGLRGVFRQSGSIVGVAIPAALVSRSGHAARTLSEVFVVFAIVLACTLLAVHRIPEHRGSW